MRPIEHAIVENMTASHVLPQNVSCCMPINSFKPGVPFMGMGHRQTE